MALAEAPERSALIIADPTADAVSKLEKVLITGDLGALTPEQRVFYYTEVCESVGLNPLTKPFDYLHLNNKLVLYANRGCTDQLRAVKRIEVTKLEREKVDDLAIVTAYGRDATGRQDSAIGAVSIKGLAGEQLANALMKAETKAKRRLTLSLAGLGLLDEVEVDSIPGAWRADVDVTTGEIAAPAAAPLSLAERIAAQAADVTGSGELPVAESGGPVEPAQVDGSRPGSGEPGGAAAAEEGSGPASAAPPAPAEAAAPAVEQMAPLEGGDPATAEPAVEAEPGAQGTPRHAASAEAASGNAGVPEAEAGSAVAVTQCQSTSDTTLGPSVQCRRGAGHSGPHKTHDRSWPQ
jgi:hypothetical protein